MVEEVTTGETYYEQGGERKRTIPFTVELREWLIIAHKIGLVFLDTLQDMRVLTIHQQGMVCGCFENLAIYQFSESSTDPDDGESVIKPENSYETGRWLLKAKLDSGYNELVFKELRTDFPTVGNPLYLYIARDTRYIYWWNPNTNTYHNAITNFATQSFFSENSGKLGGELPSHYYNLARLIDCITAGTDISIDSTSIAGKIIINYTGSSGGLTFSDLVGIIQAGTNITLDVDLLNETITINSSGGSSNWETEDETHIKPIDSKLVNIEKIDPTNSSTLTSVADTDLFQFWTTAWKRISWANIKSTLKTYFDGIYVQEVRTDTTLTGNGTLASPLGITPMPKLNINNIVKSFAGQLYGMAVKCNITGTDGRLCVCETSAVNIYDTDALGNPIQSTKTSIVTVTTGCACYVPDTDEFWVIQRLGDTIYRIDATNKTLTDTLTITVATSVNRYCFEYYNGFVYYQRGANSSYINRIRVSDGVETTGVGMFNVWPFEHGGVKYLATLTQNVNNGLSIRYESDLSNYNTPTTIVGFGAYKRIIYYNNKLYLFNDYTSVSLTGSEVITRVFDMNTLTYDTPLNYGMISPVLVDSKYVVGKVAINESTIVLRDLSTGKVVSTLTRDTTTNISIQPFCYCPYTKTIYYAHQNATAGNNAVVIIPIY